MIEASVYSFKLPLKKCSRYSGMTHTDWEKSIITTFHFSCTVPEPTGLVYSEAYRPGHDTNITESEIRHSAAGHFPYTFVFWNRNKASNSNLNAMIFIVHNYKTREHELYQTRRAFPQNEPYLFQKHSRRTMFASRWFFVWPRASAVFKCIPAMFCRNFWLINRYLRQEKTRFTKAFRHERNLS